MKFHFLKKVIRNYRDFGWGATTTKIFGQIILPIYCSRRYWLYRADLDQITIPPPREHKFDLRCIETPETHAVEQIIEMEEWLDGRLQDLLNSGSKCLLAMDGDTVAGFNLFSYGRIHVPVVHYECPLNQDEAYSEQITVSKAYRGHGLGSILRFQVYRIIKGEGKRFLIGGTDVNNSANLALCRKVGLVPIAELHYRKRLWKQATEYIPVDDR